MKFLEVDSCEEIVFTTYDDEDQNILMHLSAKEGNKIEFNEKMYQLATDAPYVSDGIVHVYLIELEDQ